MKCAVWYGLHDLRIEDRPIPDPGPEEVLVQMAACGVCGTDVHIMDGEFPIFQPPRIIGHESAGTVVAVGSRVTNVRVGDRVAVAPSVSCKKCFHCWEGQELLCSRRTLHPGGFAEYLPVPEEAVFPLPEGISWEVAALAEPLACCLHAVTLAGVRPGDRVAVVGAGAIGLMVLQLVRHAGAGLAVVSDPVPERRALAERLGADLTLDPRGVDPVQATRDLTAGIGVDVAIECVGSAVTAQTAIALPRRGGTVVIMGVAPTQAEISIRPYDIYERQLTIKGSFIRQYNFRRTVSLLPRLNLAPIVTHHFPIERTAEAIEGVRNRLGVKIQVWNQP